MYVHQINTQNFLNINKYICKGIANKRRHKNTAICVAALCHTVWGFEGVGWGMSGKAFRHV